LTVFLALGLASADAALAQTPAPSAPQAPAASAPAKPATTSKTASGAQTSTKSAQTPGAKRPAASAAAPLQTAKQKASYAIGQNIGNGLKKDEVDVDGAALARGIRDAIAGNKSLLTDEESKAALTALATEVRAKQQAKLQQLSAANKEAGDAFLASNKTKEGVVALPSGLQYQVEKAGTGPKPVVGDEVVCNYSGTLLEGKEFDSSYKRGQPVTLQVGKVIKGWNEALQLMPVGSKWKLFIPADLAYGDRGTGQEIGPNSTLIFEVELLSIAPKPEAKPEAAKPDATKPDAAKPDATKPDAKPEAKQPDTKPSSN
jgi:FKBP-type peptidyl-prolyl cis-trans isomerase